MNLSRSITDRSSFPLFFGQLNFSGDTAEPPARTVEPDVNLDLAHQLRLDLFLRPHHLLAEALVAQINVVLSGTTVEHQVIIVVLVASLVFVSQPLPNHPPLHHLHPPLPPGSVLVVAQPVNVVLNGDTVALRPSIAEIVGKFHLPPLLPLERL